MRMLRLLILSSVMLCLTGTVRSQSKPIISTRDVENFWIAYDSLKYSCDSIGTIQSLYINTGSRTLTKFLNQYDYSARDYVAIIRAYPEYWESIRSVTLGISRRKQEMESALEKVKTLCEGFKTPDVYFIIGCLKSGGTTRNNQIVIGSELAAANSATVTHELPHWQRSVIGHTGDIVAMVAHEAIHTQQKLLGFQFIWGYLNHRLLTLSLSEGAADFVSELAIGEHINNARMEFGLRYEETLWKEFKKDMMKNDVSKWLYNGGSATTPDMGYFIGYQVCKSLYESLPDKKKAIKQILKMSYSKRFLKSSNYEKKWAHT